MIYMRSHIFLKNIFAFGLRGFIRLDPRPTGGPAMLVEMGVLLATVLCSAGFVVWQSLRPAGIDAEEEEDPDAPLCSAEVKDSQVSTAPSPNRGQQNIPPGVYSRKLRSAGQSG